MAIHAQIGEDFPQDQTLIQLVNIDGTCYINAALQALFSIPSVQEFIWGCDRVLGESGMKDLAESQVFGHFVKIYVDSMRAPQNEVWYEPTLFLDRVFESGRFKKGEKCDSYEFLMFLWHSIEKSCIELNNALGHIAFASFTELFELSIAASSRHLYFGSVMTEKFMLLPLQVCSSSLYQNLRDAMSDGDLINREFLHIPRVLGLVMSLFVKGNETLSKKLNRIEIPLSLELRDNDGEKRYELCSVIAHCGCDLDDGHYICIFRVKEHWILGDDAHLRGLSQDDIFSFLVQQQLLGYKDMAVYMVFYQRE
jgi:ubiquitin C-terminal hydrolase